MHVFIFCLQELPQPLVSVAAAGDAMRRPLYHHLTLGKVFVTFCVLIAMSTTYIALYPMNECNCDTKKPSENAAHKWNEAEGQDAKRLSLISGKIAVPVQHRDPNKKYEEDEEDPGDNKTWGPNKLAILVPFRDRFEELMEFAPHLHKYLIKKKVRHKIYVINQVDNLR